MNQESDATGGVIPYKNKCALIGYYMGIASLIPCIGPFFGIAAAILGIIGLINKSKNPAIRGSVHAIVAIVLGLGSILVHLLLFILPALL